MYILPDKWLATINHHLLCMYILILSSYIFLHKQLEKGGKAECGGLFVGDVVYSINNVQLSGMRSEAIQFVKQSGHRLVLEVER